MNVSPITLEPMQAKYNQPVSRLLVESFRNKFQPLTKMSDSELARCFEILLHHFPDEPASQRAVAVQNGEVVGTLSLKWKTAEEAKQENLFPPWDEFKTFGKWQLLKLTIGLYFLTHQLKVGECYIADVAVHPLHQGKGVGKLLMQWALNEWQDRPQLDQLSLHVSGKNQRAKQLYEQLSFCTQTRQQSLTSLLLFKEYEWEYMVRQREAGESA